MSTRRRLLPRPWKELFPDRVPASYLQEHADARALLDLPAAGRLTSVAKPCLVDKVNWDERLIKCAVLWLCEQTGKRFKLQDDDFRQHDLHQLLRHHGPAQKLAHRVFRWMQDTIEYHPAGREPRRTLCFSPHPDDDVISMGGTLIRMVEDGHEVHVAYMTSGNIAVFDHDAYRIADLVTEYNRLFGTRPTEVAGGPTAGPAGLEQSPARPAGSRRHLKNQRLDQVERGSSRCHACRLSRRAFAFSRPAVLPHRHNCQTPDGS